MIPGSPEVSFSRASEPAFNLLPSTTPQQVRTLLRHCLEKEQRRRWPDAGSLGIPGVYDIDDAHLAKYAKAARTREGFQRYLEEFVCTPAKSFSPASSPA